MRAISLAAVSAILVQVPLFVAYGVLPAFTEGASLGDVAGATLFYLYWILIVAGGVVLIIGIPVFLMMRRLNFLMPMHFAVAGFGVAFLLSAIVFWPMSLGGLYSSGMTYHGTYRDMVVDGVPTLWGWLSFGETVLTFAVHGALGAIAFLLVWRKVSRSASAP